MKIRILLLALVGVLAVATTGTAGAGGPMGPQNPVVCPNPTAPDHDGDGIPNGLDPDYVPPKDGSGFGFGKGGPGNSVIDMLRNYLYLWGYMGVRPGPSMPGTLGSGPAGGFGPGDGSGNDGDGPEDGTGYGPGPAGTGDCDGNGERVMSRTRLRGR
jgi:hypothetical protein